MLCAIQDVHCNRVRDHMGQFLRGGNFGCFMSLFFKVEPLCPRGPTELFLALKTYDKQLTIEKMGLSHHVWSQGGSSLKTAKKTALHKPTHMRVVRMDG